MPGLTPTRLDRLIEEIREEIARQEDGQERTSSRMVDADRAAIIRLASRCLRQILACDAAGEGG